MNDSVIGITEIEKVMNAVAASIVKDVVEFKDVVWAELVKELSNLGIEKDKQLAIDIATLLLQYAPLPTEAVYAIKFILLILKKFS